MRSLFRPGRSVVHCINGAAASSHPLSSLAAVEVLRQGGNAIDAAVTACAVQCVVEPMSTGIGGDCFVLYSPGGSRDVVALNGSGRAPAGLDAAQLQAQGLSSIPTESPHAVTIPGAIDAWSRLLADHGTWDLARVLAPAITYAEEGFAVTPRVAWDWSRSGSRFSNPETGARFYLKDGVAPVAGERWASPELAATLRRIARDGRDGFYKGPVAEDIVGFLNGLGGRHSLDDFASHTSEYVTPISSRYRDHEVLQIPPNGQGITTLILLNILQGYELSGLDPNGALRLHLEAEATRLAFDARNQHVGDPAHGAVPVERLLSADFAAEQRATIDPERAGRPLDSAGLAAYRDTVYLTVVDKDRNAVSFINSLYFPFGSTLVAPESGVMLQNRGAGFRVEPGHPNCVAPGKRPLHTIIPGMVFEGDRLKWSYGVMGGGYQPVGHAHVLTNMIDYGMDEQEALDNPRAFYEDGTYYLEEGIPDGVAAALQGMGHNVKPAGNPYGGGQIIGIDWDNGTLAAASEPRKDGIAIGY
ncbi:gamma-glutamyltransferase [Oceanibacterium hippocampi]|uniref:Glutathione hydrolase proenzyme n=1 Tax=Oceanibacterium hippocampi TaxID=745714 RepID=A0A1Y5RYK0_9PROT|nr:gamma-glutamyltransferase [Oceanibacterium hippocampi]SLN25904.1 Putative gamma-glutamyltransferase YwrD [Oceanibacterium hippocampi]